MGQNVPFEGQFIEVVEPIRIENQQGTMYPGRFVSLANKGLLNLF